MVASILLAAGSDRAMAQNSNLSDHDRYIHNQSERNTKYFNNADSYPKVDSDNYARFRAQQQSTVNRTDRSGEGTTVSVEQHRQTREEYTQDLQRKSATGDALAKFELANCYYRAWGVPLNKAEAYRLYREAGATNSQAEAIAAGMLYYGDGIPADQAEGLAMFRRAAAAGDPASVAWFARSHPSEEMVEQSAIKNDYGPMLSRAADLLSGQNGEAKDQAKAQSYFRRLVEAGNRPAMEYLAEVSSSGYLEAEDLFVKVEQWLIKADATGDGEAAYALAQLAERFTKSHKPDWAAMRKWSEKYVATNPSPKAYQLMGQMEIMSDHDNQARSWWSKAVDGGETVSEERLGSWEWSGRGGPEDEPAGRKHLEAAAARGDGFAMYELGLACTLGRHGMAVDPVRAFTLFQTAASKNIADAQSSLAMAYYKGVGVPQDYANAAKWAQQATDLGAYYAPLVLARLYTDGTGVPKDLQKAATFLQSFAKEDDADVMAMLAWDYYNGDLVPKDNDKAREWAVKASAKGAKRAALLLQMISMDSISFVVPTTPPAPPPDADHKFIDAQQRYLAGEKRAEAAFQLAQCYYSGVGTPVNKPYAYKYWHEYAEENAEALFRSSVMEYEGDGVDKNERSGLEGIQHAARLEEERHAVAWLAEHKFRPVLSPFLYRSKKADEDAATKMLYGSDADKNWEEAAKLVTARAEEGYPWANVYLGVMLRDGMGMEKDMTKAFWAYYAAADTLTVAPSNPWSLAAAQQLGTAYWSGKSVLGLPVNDQLAIHYLTPVAKTGDSRANFLFGEANEQATHGFPSDIARAEEYYVVAAKDDDNSVTAEYAAKAAARLAELYFRGESLAQDFEKSAEFAEKSAKHGNADGMLTLAYLCRDGVGGVETDPLKSVEWMQKAAAGGNPEAKAEIEKGFNGQ